MARKVLIATVKPFAPAAVQSIKETLDAANYEMVLLEKYESKAELLEAVKDVDGLIIRSDKVDAEVMDAGKNLKIVVRAGAGYDNVQLQDATDRNITVMNTPGQNSNAVAELVIGLMLQLARKQFSGKAGSELKGKTLGIHAYGYVGKRVAKIAKGFDMEVFAFDPFLDKETIEKDGVTPVETAEELYAACNYISLHLPKTPKTLGLVNYDLMSRLKDGGAVVNTARAEVVCEESVKKLLEENEKFLYASDVAPKIKDELVEKFADRVFFTPKKMGAQTLEANVNAGIAAAKQIIDFLENGVSTFKVNK